MKRAFIVLCLPLLTSCSRGTSEPPEEAKTGAAAPAASPQASAAPASPHAAAGSPHAMPGAPPTATPKAVVGPEQAGGLKFHAPEPLVQRPPGSSMRAAEYALAEAPDAALTVFFFPGQGGGIDANIARWVGQFTQPDGSNSQERAQITKLKDSKVPVTRVELLGSFGGGMAMPGGQPPKGIEDAMLLGAIAEGPNGPLFFKWVGPAKLLSANEGAFDALIASVQPL